ncbi:MAG: hypothetical protein AAFN70_10615, partial [Planctomycetota bacterium]
MKRFFSATMLLAAIVFVGSSNANAQFGSLFGGGNSSSSASSGSAGTTQSNATGTLSLPSLSGNTAAANLPAPGTPPQTIERQYPLNTTLAAVRTQIQARLRALRPDQKHFVYNVLFEAQRRGARWDLRFIRAVELYSLRRAKQSDLKSGFLYFERAMLTEARKRGIPLQATRGAATSETA